ncbi:substrate-binding domain-containing protein [Metabacillus flavus]|uniref:substrate-binding domain-containing protein n=1 Tax=Metabacillus flavus TaxID=2823519 RepID=UPI003266340C
MGTRHLIEKGHKRIAFCQGSFRSFISIERETGYKLAMEEADLQIHDDWAFRIAADYHDGKEVLRKIVSMKDRPTAIFTGSDQVAAGIVFEARLMGLNVPEDLAVIGFDDQPIAEMTFPQLTTIRQPAYEMGERAMKLMLNLLLPEEESPEMPEEPLKLEIVERCST